MTIEVSNTSRGSTDNLAIGRESVPADGPSYRRTEGRPKELNILAEPE